MASNGRIKIHGGDCHASGRGHWRYDRVSLTEAPEKEIPVCYSILQALGLRKTMVDVRGLSLLRRTLFNLEDVLHEVRRSD